MTFRDTVIDHCKCPCQSYEECSDPSFKNTFFFIEIIPNYPVKSACWRADRLMKHSFRNALPYILKSTDSFHDFPVTVIVNYFTQTGRQHIYFSNKHALLCLYNHSDFFKMRSHNAWLLERWELMVDLLETFSSHHYICFYFVEMSHYLFFFF